MITKIRLRLDLGNMHGRISIQLIATFNTIQLFTEHFIATLNLIKRVFQLFDHAFFEIPGDIRYLFRRFALKCSELVFE
jgi:hypothetical protein